MSSAFATADQSATALVWDVEIAEKKLVDLGEAIPEGMFSWQPDGARSVREVLLHVASNNYLLPAMIGHTPDPSTGITTEPRTVAEFEKRDLSKDSVIAEVKASFRFLKESLQSTTAESMAAPISLFGQQFTGQSWWTLSVTHVHENLGQLIAYARVNGVKPPWN